MAEAIRALVALDHSANREVLQRVFPKEPEVEVVGLVESLQDGAPSEASNANLLVVACGGYSDHALEYIESAVREHPDRPVVVVCGGSANGFVRRVFEVGADDIVVLPAAGAQAERAVEDVLFTFQKAVARRNGARAGSGSAKGRMICVLGPKGGIGKTLTTVNLAVSLADEGQRVVVVDLDLQFGDCRSRARTRAGEDDLRPRHLGRRDGRGEGRCVPRRRTSRECGCCWPRCGRTRPVR